MTSSMSKRRWVQDIIMEANKWFDEYHSLMNMDLQIRSATETREKKHEYALNGLKATAQQQRAPRFSQIFPPIL